MGNQQVTDAETGWLAGMIDGEGSVAIQRCHHNSPSGRRGYYSARCQVVNTDPLIIEAVVDVLRRLGIGHYITSHLAKARTKTLHTVRVDKFESIERLLSIVEPHLRGEKQAKARLLLPFVRSRMAHGKNVKGNKFLPIPYSPEETAMAERLWHWNLNDYTRGAVEVGA